MTISFSGLASGLDTSAWIKALTNLRLAKVNTITAQKEKVTVSQNALASIRSYFSNFQSSLEKLTDAKFGISTIDLFDQNIATSSNNKAFTATATAGAEENSYDVAVKALATSTKAKSTYNTQITNKTTAVKQSTLKDIGMESGKVMFRVNGIDRGIVVDNTDTLSAFVDKLKKIGVSASYNETTGAFSLDVSVTDINDKGNTGIVEKLHLTGVNEGYQSNNKLQVKETKENVEKAGLETFIKDLDTGIHIEEGAYVEVTNSSGEVYNLYINEQTTLEDFVTGLKDAGLYAKFDTEKAVLEISGGTITGGSFDAASIFGLTEQAHSAMSTGNLLSETIIIPETVTLQTKLVDDIGVEKGYLEITTPNGTNYYEKIYSGQTMADLMADLGNLGITSSLDSEKGILTVTGGSFRTLSDEEVNELVNNAVIIEDNESLIKGTNLLDILGFKDSTTVIKSAVTQSQALTYQKTDVAYNNDRLSDYITIPDNKEIVIHEKTGEEIGTVTIDETSTFENLFGLLAEYGVDGHIQNGQVMIDAKRELYVTGDVIDALGFNTTYVTTITTTTVGKSQTTEEKTFEKTDYARSESVVNDFVKINTTGANQNNEIVVKDKDGNPTATITINATSTFGDIFNLLAPEGVIGKINDGILNFVNSNGGYVDGSFITAIGMTTTYNTVVTTTTVGGTQTTGEKTFNTVDIADYDSVINNFISLNSTNNNLVVKDIDGNVKGSVTISETMTFNELFEALVPLGVTGDVEDGQITFIENEGGYVDGSFVSALGMSTTYTTVTTTTTVGGTQTTDEKTFKALDIARDDSVINDFNLINNTSNQIVIKNADGDPTKTVTVTDTMTFRDLFSELSKHGVYGGLQEGMLTLYDNNGGYVDGSFCRSIGMTTDYTTIYTTSTVGQTSTGGSFKHTITLAATGSTTFKDIGATGNQDWTIVDGQTGRVVASGTFNENTSIGEFSNILGQSGFNAGIEGGYFVASSEQGLYVTGSAANVLGLTTYTYTMSSHGTYTATIAATDTQVINQTRVLDVASSGLVTVNAEQTIVVNQTRTLNVASAGSITVNAVQTLTVNIAQTLAVTTTQTRTVTTTIVNTWTVSQNVTTTTNAVLPQGSTPAGVAKKTDSLQAISLLGQGQSLTFSVNNYTHTGYIGNSFQSYYAFNYHYQDAYSDYHAAYVDYHPAYQDAGHLGYVAGYTQSLATYHPAYVGGGYTSYVPGYTGLVSYYVSGSYVPSHYVSPSEYSGYGWGVFPAYSTPGYTSYYYGYTSGYTYYVSSSYNAAYVSGGQYVPAYTNSSYVSGYNFYAPAQQIRFTNRSRFPWDAQIDVNELSQFFKFQQASSLNPRPGQHAPVIIDSNYIIESYQWIYYVPPTPAFVYMDALENAGLVNNFSYWNGYVTCYTNAQSWYMPPGVQTTYVPGYVIAYQYNAGYTYYIPGPYHAAYNDYHPGYTTYYYQNYYNYGGNGPSYSYNWTLSTSYTTGTVASCTLSASDSVQSAMDKINSMGIGTVSFNESTGQFSLSLNNGYFISDDLAAKFGFNTRNTVVYQEVHQHTGYVTTYAYTTDATYATGSQHRDSQYVAPTFAGVTNGAVIARLVSGGTSKQFTALRPSLYDVNVPVTNNTTVNRTITTTSTSVQTVTFQTTGTTTVNVSRVMTVDVTRTVAVATAGLTTVNIAQTLTINATQTTKADVTGKTTVNIAQTLTVTAHQTITVDITSTRTITANKSTNKYNTYKDIENMSGSSRLCDYALGGGTFTVVHAGTISTLNFVAEDTVDSLIARLGAYGIEASISAAGAMTFKGTSDGFILGATGSALNLGALGAFSTSTSTIVRGVTSAANPKSRLITKTMQGDTTFGELGLEGGCAVVNNKGTEYVIRMGRDNTMYDLMIALGGYGVSASIKDGKMTVTGTTDAFITRTDSGIEALGITESKVESTTTVVNGKNSASARETRNVINTMTSDTTLSQLGWKGGTLYGVSNNSGFSIEMGEGSSIGELINALASNGITGTISNDGKLTLTGSSNGYITGATGGLETGLGILQSTVEQFSTAVQGSTSASNPNRQITLTMNSETTFGDLGCDSGTAKVVYDGKEYNIAMNASNTMQDFMTALSGYGISASIKNGQMTVQGTNKGFILSTSGGLREFGIKTSTVQTETTVITGDNGLSTTLSRTTNPILERSTRLVDLFDKDGNNLGITEGSYYVYENGVRYTKTVTAETTVNDLLSTLAEHNFVTDIQQDGTITISGNGASYLSGSAIGGTDNTNLIEKIFSNWDFTKIYNSEDLTMPVPELHAITRDTKLKDIASDIKMQEGLITVVKDGVQVNLYVNEDDTVGTFMNELGMHGFDTVINKQGQLIVKSTGNSKLQNYDYDEQGSNILDILGINSDNWIQTKSYESKNENVITFKDIFTDANENTLLSSIYKDDSVLETFGGTIEMNVDGVRNTVKISDDDSVGAVLNKFRALGLEATISNGKILIQSGFKDIDINEANSTSALGRSNTSIGLGYNSDFGGYSSSNQEIISTTYENKDISVSNWADMDTSLASLNITSGTLSVYRDGQKATINVASDDTFATLQSKIQNKLNDIELSFDNGRLIFKSNQGFEVAAGSSTDTSNFSSITGIKSDGNNVKSSKELFKLNTSVALTSDALFRQGNITEGTFTIGEETFTIDSTTTLDDVVAMINNSDKSTANAYWDSVEGKLYIESKLSGSMYVNIEKGTSNFTDIMGLTVNDKDSGDNVINVNSQDVGRNAVFTINGTTYTSNSNTINSDISRIEGVTLYLKNVSKDVEKPGVTQETLTIKKDRETLSNKIEEVVDSYNELMENVDQAISAEGDLSDQTTLKMIRNQLRSLMTSSLSGLSSYRNLDAVGICVDKATASNISVNNLTRLTFDKEKFTKAYDADPFGVKQLMIGNDTNKGVLIRIENLVQSTLAGVTGYFDTQNASYIKQIQQFNDKISRENMSTSRYQELLESRFSSLDMLVAQMQQQYSSFLTSVK